MFIGINSISTANISISDKEAFQILCMTLGMQYALNDKYIVKKNEYGENRIYIRNEDSELEFSDDRGDLLIALRTVALHILPSIMIENTDYIKNKDCN